MTEESEEIECIEHLEGKNSRIVLEDKECKFLKEKKKPPLFILGFTGAGLIGTIVTNELIKQLEMEQLGYILSEDLPPITIFYDGIIKHPFRLYYSDEYNILVSICEVPFRDGSYADIARSLMDWALDQNIKEVICLQGLADRSLLMQEEHEIKVFAAGEKGIMNKITNFDVDKPPKGIIVGAEAAILNECLNNRLDGAVFLTPANPQIPSPEGSAAILKKIGEIYDFPVDTKELIEQSNEIKKKLFELAKKSNQIHQQSQQGDQGSKPERFYS